MREVSELVWLYREVEEMEDFLKQFKDKIKKLEQKDPAVRWWGHSSLGNEKDVL